jgi:hypothetical protein
VAGEYCNRPSDGAINSSDWSPGTERSIPNSCVKFSAITVLQAKLATTRSACTVPIGDHNRIAAIVSGAAQHAGSVFLNL